MTDDEILMLWTLAGSPYWHHGLEIDNPYSTEMKVILAKHWYSENKDQFE